MYIPNYFRIDDVDTILDFIGKNGFALLLTSSGEEVYNTQIPIMCNKEGEKITLSGHMARENPHWKIAEGRKATVLFLGPHQYISPRWYTIEKSVPTWDYMTVRMTGTFRSVAKNEANKILLELSEYYDREWAQKRMDKEVYYQKMVDEIVAFRIEVNEVMGKWKLSQNRPLADRRQIIENLKSTNIPESLEVAEMIEKYSLGNPKNRNINTNC